MAGCQYLPVPAPLYAAALDWHLVPNGSAPNGKVVTMTSNRETRRARRARIDEQTRQDNAYAALIGAAETSARLTSRRTGRVLDAAQVTAAAHDAWLRLHDAAEVVSALTTWCGLMPERRATVADASAACMARATGAAVVAADRDAARSADRAAASLAAPRPRSDTLAAGYRVDAAALTPADACAIAAHYSRGVYLPTVRTGPQSVDHAWSVVAAVYGAPTTVRGAEVWAPGARLAPVTNGAPTRKDSAPSVSDGTLLISHCPSVELLAAAREHAVAQAVAEWERETETGRALAAGYTLADRGSFFDIVPGTGDRGAVVALAYAPRRGGSGRATGAASRRAIHATVAHAVTYHAVSRDLDSLGRAVRRAVAAADIR